MAPYEFVSFSAFFKYITCTARIAFFAQFTTFSYLFKYFFQCCQFAFTVYLLKNALALSRPQQRLLCNIFLFVKGGNKIISNQAFAQIDSIESNHHARYLGL
jgi:hypothetical protein